MPKITFADEIVERAGLIMKVVRLANTVGMDVIAIRLNAILTEEDKRIASKWAKAFELAMEGGDLYRQVGTMRKEELL